MKILLVNPNTSRHMTYMIEKSARQAASKDVEVIVKNPESGPEAIESFMDEATSTINIIREVIRPSLGKIDAVVIACFDDPGMYALREILDIPVLGIGESSILMALALGWKYSILAVSEKAIPLMENMVFRYGLEKRLASIESMKLSVVDVDRMSEEEVLKPLVEAGERARSRGAEVLILGCAGLAGYDEKLSKKLDMPVIDPVKAGVKLAETILAMRLNISKVGLFSKLVHSEW
ncbi:MAG: aspartate/glutamate racemase family protein [Nitrososphaerota archaeon]